MSYSVTLSNGTTFSGLRISGTCFVSSQKITPEMFSGTAGKVIISGTSDGGLEPCPYEIGEHKYMELGRVFEVEGESYFYLTEPSEEELLRMKDRADIEYIAMMSGVEL